MLLPAVRPDLWPVPCHMLWTSNANSRGEGFLQVMLKKISLEQVTEHRGAGMCERSTLSSGVVSHTQPTKKGTADENREVKAVML